MYADGGNLYLQVSPTGTKSWGFKYYRSKQHYLGLGSYPDVSLKDAREKAAFNRRLLIDGVDPLAHKRRQKRTQVRQSISFREITEDYIAAKASGWTEKHTKRFRSSLTTYAFPRIGSIAVGEMQTNDILTILRPIWEAKNETASQVRGRIEMVLDYATAIGLRAGDNPARWKGHLSHLLAKRSSVAPVQHFKALPYGDMPSFMVSLRKHKGLSARCLELCILTATRIGSVIGARWDEFEGAVWTIPAERMKGTAGLFKVPLSKTAQALLKELPQIDDSPYLFPSKGTHLTIASPLRLLQVGMGNEGLTVHGFRSTFRDWSAEQTAYPNHVCEMALAHAIGSDVEKAYRRGDLFQKRARLMEDWARYLNSTPGEVIPIRKAT